MSGAWFVYIQCGAFAICMLFTVKFAEYVPRHIFYYAERGLKHFGKMRKVSEYEKFWGGGENIFCENFDLFKPFFWINCLILNVYSPAKFKVEIVQRILCEFICVKVGHLRLKRRLHVMNWL